MPVRDHEVDSRGVGPHGRALSSSGMETRGRASFGVGRPEDAWRADLEVPIAIEQALTLEQVPHVVAWAEEQTRLGRWVVLLLAYEAAPAFDDSLAVRSADLPAGPAGAGPVPLAWAACYDTASIAPTDAVEAHACQRSRARCLDTSD